MSLRILARLGLATSLLGVLGGCEAARGMRDDLARLTSSPAALQKSQPARPAPSTGRPRSGTSASAVAPNATGSSGTLFPEPPPSQDVPPPSPVSLAGKSEAELRALLGIPTNEEQRPPGKLWRYRDGPCSLEIQLYPDVQTKQFGTLAYEVKSDDNSDEGKRACLAQFQTRAQSRP